LRRKTDCGYFNRAQQELNRRLNDHGLKKQQRAMAESTKETHALQGRSTGRSGEINKVIFRNVYFSV
jgi:hypothetical protein